MRSNIKTSRVVAFGLIVTLLIALCVGTLYKMQIIEGAAHYDESLNSQVSTQTVTAARGNILDRYGRVLVSNRECYNLVINTTRLFGDDVEDPNALILEMVNIVEAAGIDYTDDLPITDSPPFEYVSNMTALQRSMLEAYLDDHDLAEDTSAVELMSYFRTRYDIDNGYSSEDMRKISSVRYALNVRYSINTNEYIFVEDASIDLISDLMGAVGNIIEVRSSYVREYNTQYAAHVLGYSGLITADQIEQYMRGDNSGYSYDSQVGQYGSELAFEDWLHGSDGTARVTRNLEGTITNTTYTEDPVPGNHVYLTIDIQLQEAVERALANGIISLQQERDQENAKAIQEGRTDEVREDVKEGAVVVVDVDTGEPLAIASYPTFDASQILDADYFAEITDVGDDPNEPRPLYNYALQGTYAPGSTFKPLTALAALTENIINTETRIDCEGVFSKYADQGYAPHCWVYDQTDGLITHGNDNVSEAIRDSCNYFFYTISDQMGIDIMDEYAAMFGLGQKTGVELYEESGVVGGRAYTESLGQTWYEGSVTSVAIGQESTQVTPIQLTNYISTLVNGGTRYSTHLLKTVKSSDFSQVIYEYEPQVQDEINIAQENLEAVTEGMRELTTGDGSLASAFRNLPFEVGAKTGSAQVSSTSDSNAVFVCYAPYDDPEIAISLVVEHGGSGSVLASLAAEILAYYFTTPDSQSDVVTENTLVP